MNGKVMFDFLLIGVGVSAGHRFCLSLYFEGAEMGEHFSRSFLKVVEAVQRR